MACENIVANVRTVVFDKKFNSGGIYRLFITNWYANFGTEIVKNSEGTWDLSGISTVFNEYSINSNSGYNQVSEFGDFGVSYKPSVTLVFSHVDYQKNNFLTEISNPNSKVIVVLKDNNGNWFSLGSLNGLSTKGSTIDGENSRVQIELSGSEPDSIYQIEGSFPATVAQVDCQTNTTTVVTSGFDCERLLDCPVIVELQADLLGLGNTVTNLSNSLVNNYVANNRVVQVTGTSVSNLISQSGITSILASFVSGPPVVQITGNSLTSVMSQSAVTSALTTVNAIQFAGQLPAYYLNRTNHTGTQLSSTVSDFSASTSGVVNTYRASYTGNSITQYITQSGFTSGITTVNAIQLGSQLPAFYLARANHTGTQLITTISNFSAGTSGVVNTYITQVTGNSLSLIMSQSAVTQAINSAITQGNLIVNLFPTTSPITLNFGAANYFNVFMSGLTADFVFNYSGLTNTAGTSKQVRFVQGATGRQITFTAGRFEFPFGIAPSFTIASGNTELLTFSSFENNRYAVVHTPSLRKN